MIGRNSHAIKIPIEIYQVMNEINHQTNKSNFEFKIDKYITNWNNKSQKIFRKATQEIQQLSENSLNQSKVSTIDWYYAYQMILGSLIPDYNFDIFLENQPNQVAVRKFTALWEQIRQTIFDYTSNTCDAEEFISLSEFDHALLLQIIIDFLQISQRFEITSQKQKTAFEIAFKKIKQLNGVDTFQIKDSETDTMEFILSM